MMKEQVVAELSGCEPSIVGDKEKIIKVFREALVGFSVEEIFVKEFSPYGLTVVAVLGTSHAVMHTYPELGKVLLDIFVCGELPPSLFVGRFVQEVCPKHVVSLALNREEGITVKSDDTFEVKVLPGLKVSYQPYKVLYSNRSQFQQIDVIEHKTFGKMLFLDGSVQLAESDISQYNEELLRYFSPKKKCVIFGGGDGFLADDLIKLGVVPIVYEIDKEVADVCRTFFGKGNAVKADWRYQDCLKVEPEELEESVLFLDLTDIPIGSETRIFLFQLLDKIGKVKDIEVIAYAGNILDKTFRVLIDELRRRGFETMSWERFIPSYLTICVFVKAWR